MIVLLHEGPFKMYPAKVEHSNQDKALAWYKWVEIVLCILSADVIFQTSVNDITNVMLPIPVY